jgi:hypothetical protein
LESIKKKSLIEIPSEAVPHPKDMLMSYDTKILSNHDKRCFKKPSFQSTQSENPDHLFALLDDPAAEKSSEATPPLSQIKSATNLSHQQSQSMELSFFSHKKVAEHKEQELQYIKQIEELRAQLQQSKTDCQKKTLRLQQYQAKVASLERMHSTPGKENVAIGRQSVSLMKALNDALRSFK